MKRALAAAGVFLALAAPLSAHRLDEYLQAARVSLEHDHVVLEMDLTPGAAVADGIIAMLDRDGDGRITPLEAESYGRTVLSEVIVDLDNRPVSMTLNRVEVPPLDEMRHGMGAIQLRAVAAVEPTSTWRRRRQLHVRNNHHPPSSVYLVNAMMPADGTISVVAQTRDATQREARIDYRVNPQWPKYVYWPVFAAVALFFMRRRKIVRSVDH